MIISVSNKAYSQLLKGEWEGDFIFNNLRHRIYLEFILNPDTTYSVFSYSEGLNSEGKDPTVICKVYYKLLSQDSIYLEELEVIAPKNAASTCLQKMYLRIVRRKKSIQLAGTWNSDTEDCEASGGIFFVPMK